MNQGRTVFAQMIGHAPHTAFQRCVKRYLGASGRTSKRLNSELSLYTMLQILSVSLFEKIELSQAFSRAKLAMPEEPTCNQLQPFDL